MVLRWRLTYLFLFLVNTLSPACCEVFPGGELVVRPSLFTERGSHPKIVVQTVPDATTTATCLVIRYAEQNKASSPPGVAHLFEHMHYRSEPGGKPGGLLLRNEFLGNENRAWVTPTKIVFSELVPSSEGLASLKLQLARLSGVPDDPEGLRLEKRSLKAEIQNSRQEEEQGRRSILRSLGFAPDQEGDLKTLDALKPDDLRAFLSSIHLENDVVISIVGPHTEREIRQVLSSNLRPLAPERSSPREARASKQAVPSELTIKSNSGYDQRSYFFQATLEDPRVFTVAKTLLQMKSQAGGAWDLEREDDSLFRMDVRPADAPWDVLLADLTPAELSPLLENINRDWLAHYESSVNRAEMLALSTLRGEKPEGPIEQHELLFLLNKAKNFLAQSRTDSVSLLLIPNESSPPSSVFFPFKTKAHRSPLNRPLRQKLPNDLGVTVQRLESWPTLAISGFFRISPSLTVHQAALLEAALSQRADLKMEFEVKPNGIFFHHWAPTENAVDFLQESAQELKALSQESSFELDYSRSLGAIDEFFVGTDRRETPSPLKNARLLNPKNGHLVIVGNFSEENLDRGLRPAWSGWFSPSNTPSAFSETMPGPEAIAATAGKTMELDLDSKPILLIGFAGPTRQSPDFLAVNLGLQALAGRPNTSLLSRTLSKEEFSVNSVKVFPLSSSTLSEHSNHQQVWLIALGLTEALDDPAPLVETVREVLSGLARKPLSEKELKHTIGFLKSSLTLSASTFRGRARVLAHAEFYRLSESYAQDFAGLYDHLSPALVMGVSKKYFESPNLRWLYFRPKKPGGS